MWQGSTSRNIQMLLLGTKNAKPLHPAMTSTRPALLNSRNSLTKHRTHINSSDAISALCVSPVFENSACKTRASLTIILILIDSILHHFVSFSNWSFQMTNVQLFAHFFMFHPIFLWNFNKKKSHSEQSQCVYFSSKAKNQLLSLEVVSLYYIMHEVKNNYLIDFQSTYYN